MLTACALAAPAVAQDWDKARGSQGGCAHADGPAHSPATKATDLGITLARYTHATDEYRHGVLGDAVEAKGFVVKHQNGLCDQVDAGQDRVFEDVSPRLADLNGDGLAEVIVVASHQRQGARLEVYGYPAPGQDISLLAHTPYIGRANRWLAPIGAADLDGDGHVEIAYIDRPHLAKTLRIWRFKDNALQEVATAAGFTNHRIGEVDIAGGIRRCAGTPPEMLVATADWSRMIAITWQGKLQGRDLGGQTSRPAFRAALACR